MDHHHHDGHESFDWFHAGSHGRSGWRQSLAILGVVLLTAALAAAIAAPGADAAIATTAASHRCGQVTFDFPAGNGGASGSSIVTQGIGCKQARRVVWVCLHGRRPERWTIRYRTSYVLMRSGGRRITYRPAGGGGCL